MVDRPVTDRPVLDYLLSADAVRERSQALMTLCQDNQLEHFRCDLDQLTPTADFVLETLRQNYPDLDVPFHSRWRHFNVGGVDRLPLLRQSLQGHSPTDGAKAKLDLAIVSVLLDAGAGRQWQYRDAASGQVLSRSEGLAIASFQAFRQGLFSSDANWPYQVDAQGLQQLTLETLATAFQVSDENPLVGLAGRLTLLHRLAAALTAQPQSFGTQPPRPGNLLDGWRAMARHGALDAQDLLRTVLHSFWAIWPGRTTLNHANLGDVWPHPALPQASEGSHLVPFHKLSQWLTYSLVEPLIDAGLSVTHLNALTGLAEYRNGGLLVDMGLLVPKHEAVTAQAHQPGSSVVVEWRA
ncbi:MAG: DUF1688 family protein, partial [Cyanobacteria bacterium P01_A01_bin.105]